MSPASYRTAPPRGTRINVSTGILGPRQARLVSTSSTRLDGRARGVGWLAGGLDPRGGLARGMGGPARGLDPMEGRACGMAVARRGERNGPIAVRYGARTLNSG